MKKKNVLWAAGSALILLTAAPALAQADGGGSGDDDPTNGLRGACCLPDGTCIIVTPQACEYQYGGNFGGLGTRCGKPADQRVDINGDGEITPDDLADFITDFFSDHHEKDLYWLDFNGDGIVTGDDLIDFIDAYDAAVGSVFCG